MKALAMLSVWLSLPALGQVTSATVAAAGTSAGQSASASATILFVAPLTYAISCPVQTPYGKPASCTLTQNLPAGLSGDSIQLTLTPILVPAPLTPPPPTILLLKIAPGTTSVAFSVLGTTTGVTATSP